MKLEKLLNANVIDENTPVIVIDFNGKEDNVLFKGYASDIPTEYKSKNIEIEGLGQRRVAKYGTGLLGIFVQD